jgi:pimeloyl-ACP methyl ester carboxylesterase
MKYLKTERQQNDNGINLYYEIHGAGQPLVLLHGGVAGSAMFSPVLPALAEHRQVITVDLQAHGRTADIDRPFRYEFLADDVAALIEHLGLAQTDIMGYSLGGLVALQTTIRHPALARRLVVVSASFKRDGSYPEVLAAFDQMGPATAAFMEQSPLYQLYPGVDWAMLFTKLGDLLRQDYDWSQDVAAIPAPIMLVFADADSVRTTHMMEFYALLGGGQRDGGLDGSGRPLARLAILPGRTHYDILESPALAPTVTGFLDAHLPVAKN